MKTEFTINRPMPPLWLMYPNISKYSIGWRMGYGEGYKFDLGDWRKTLTEEENNKYQQLFPPPKLWSDYYKDMNEGDNVGKEEPIDILLCHNEHVIEFWNKAGKPEYDYNQLINNLSAGKQFEYIFFWGHQPSKDEAITASCFSQWWQSGFEIDIDKYSCMEQYMMAEKARLFGDNEVEKEIMESKDPNHIKKLGRRVNNFDETIWNKAKYSIVLNGNYHKFIQNEALREYLLGTGDKVLVEASPYDGVWGIKMLATDKGVENPLKWKGENLLGFALMEVRAELKRVCENCNLVDWDKIHAQYD